VTASRCATLLPLLALLVGGGPARAVELMTGDGYLLALTQDDQSKAEAQSYLAGTLDNLLVINEIMGSNGAPLFCISEGQASALDPERLKSEFVDWLKRPVQGADGQRPGTLPVALLGWGFLSNKFACAAGAAGSGANADIRSLLLDSLRK
jgi:hypothetical protein